MAVSRSASSNQPPVRNVGGTESAHRQLSPWTLRAALVVVIGAHLYIAYTIAAQPLGVNRYPESRRSAIWRLHHNTIHRQGPGADLFAVYRAGEAMQQGVSPYSNQPMATRVPYYYPFRYLPIVAFTLGRFLTVFEPRVAYWIWLATLEAILVVLLLLLARRFDEPLRSFVVCVLLLSSPYFLELHMGQFTFATLSFVAIGILLQEESSPRVSERWRRWLGAGWYAAAVLLKVFPLVALPALLRRRRYWPSAFLAVGAVLTSSAPYFARHGADLREFSRENFGASIWTMHAGNYGFVYLVYLALHDAQSDAVATTWGAFTTLWRPFLLGLTAVAAVFTREERIGVGVGAMIFSHFLSYRDVWEHHMSGAIVIGLLVLWTITRQPPVASPRLGMVVLISVTLLALPTPFVLLDQAKDPAVFDPATGWSSFASSVLVASKVVPVAALYATCMTLLCRGGFAAPWRGGELAEEAPCPVP